MPHQMHVFKGSTPQREFKIGIAIPCYKKDQGFLDTCLEAIENLNPQPYVTVVNLNWASSLKEARKQLFEYIFKNEKCDVILQNSVDFYLMADILKHVRRNRIVSFNPLCLRRYALSFSLYHLLFPKMGWSGCYSMPIEYWNCYKHRFDGYDSSILRQVGRFKYDFHIPFIYYNLRPYRKSSVQEFLKTKPLFKRVLWRMARMGIG